MLSPSKRKSGFFRASNILTCRMPFDGAQGDVNPLFDLNVIFQCLKKGSVMRSGGIFFQNTENGNDIEVRLASH